MNKGRQNVGLEGDTDYLVRSFLDEIKVTYTEQATNIKEIDKALIGASKSENGKGKGKPEFIFTSGNHLFIVEDKKENEKLEFIENGEVVTEYPARNDYAVNGQKMWLNIGGLRLMENYQKRNVIYKLLRI